MWEQNLKNSQVPTIYFNAWENDFSEDALVSLIGEISSALSELSKTGDESKAKKYFEKARSVSTALLKRSVPVATKMATAGMLDLGELTEQSLSDFAESLAKEQIEQYEKSKKSLRAFRKALTEFAASITNENDPKPLVFIIDELDRCRPNYSIEVLEKAKHFFNVENIVFVLGADKIQLGSSIRAIYGSGLNVNGYLRRFIDFDYLLPPPDKGRFVKALFQKYSFSEYFSQKDGRGVQYEHEHALTMFEELFDVLRLTLREQEHCCSLLNLAIKTTPHNYKLYPLFLCFLIVLKVKFTELYNDLVSERISPHELLVQFRNISGADRILESNYGMALEAHIIICKSQRHSHGDILEGYTDIMESGETTDEQKYRANRILALVKSFDFDGGVGVLGYLVNKIEVASRFKS